MNSKFNQFTLSIKDVNVNVSNKTPVITIGEVTITSQTSPEHSAKMAESLSTMFMPLLQLKNL